MLTITDDGRTVLALDDAGVELKGLGKQGESERIVLVRFTKGSVREVDVGWRKEVLREEREKSNL
jgi:hypothetical protein